MSSAYPYVKYPVSVFDYYTFGQSPLDSRIPEDFTS